MGMRETRQWATALSLGAFTVSLLGGGLTTSEQPATQATPVAAAVAPAKPKVSTVDAKPAADGLAHSLNQLRAEVNARWPSRAKHHDGTIGDKAHQARQARQARRSDHNPDADGIVRAIDITAEGIDVQALLKAVIGDDRVHYVIYDRTIYSRTYGWKARPYAGSSPHDQHVHVSLINAGAKGYRAKQRRHAADDSTPWGIA